MREVHPIDRMIAGGIYMFEGAAGFGGSIFLSTLFGAPLAGLGAGFLAGRAFRASSVMRDNPITFGVPLIAGILFVGVGIDWEQMWDSGYLPLTVLGLIPGAPAGYYAPSLGDGFAKK